MPDFTAKSIPLPSDPNELTVDHILSICRPETITAVFRDIMRLASQPAAEPQMAVAS